MDILDKNDRLIRVFAEAGIYVSNNNRDEKIHVDSLQIAILISDIEEEFNIRIDMSQVQKLEVFNDYLCMIK